MFWKLNSLIQEEDTGPGPVSCPSMGTAFICYSCLNTSSKISLEQRVLSLETTELEDSLGIV